MEILNKRFGLRNRLKDTSYHNYMGSIPKSALTYEIDPEFHEFVGRFAKELEENPNALLLDEYSEDDRKKDWNALYGAIHKLIPSFAIMGIDKKYENMAKKIQDYASTQQHTEEIAPLLKSVLSTLKQSCKELEIELINLKKNHQ